MKETKVDSLILRQKTNLSLSELLSENTPVFIKSHGRGALSTASFRGTAASHTQVNWNGIPINTPMTGMTDFSLIPVYVIDNVSLKHGNSSIADGSGGLGGSINIDNQAKWNNSFDLDYTQGIASYSTFDEYLQLGIGNKKFQWRSRAYHNYSKNDYPFINRMIVDWVDEQRVYRRDTNRNADYTRYGLVQEFYYQPAKGHIVSARWWSQWADRAIPRVISHEGPENTSINRQNDTDHRLVADWKHYTRKGSWMVRTGYSLKQLDYFLKNSIPGLGFVYDIFSQSTQQSYFNQAGYTHHLNDNFSLQASIDIDHHVVVSEDTVAKTGYEQRRSHYSYLFSGSYSFAERANVTLLLRQDLVDDHFTQAQPFAGIDIKLSEQQNLIAKANIARNYNLPSLNELYWQPGGNPDLKPEKGISMETGILYSKQWPRGMLEAEITAFRSDIDNWILWIPSVKGYWVPQNINRVLSRGVEISTKGSKQAGNFLIRSFATYAYNQAVNYGDPVVWGDESYGKQLVYIPLHSGNVFFHLSFKGYGFGWQHNSYSERFTTTSNEIQERGELYPYFMNDISLSKDFNLKRIKLSIEVKALNLFNETYHSILFRPMPKRNYALTIKANI